MDMGQGFIGTTQELNVDRGTLPSTLACSWACSWLPATGQGEGGVHTHKSLSLALSLFSLSLSLGGAPDAPRGSGGGCSRRPQRK